MPEPLPPVVSLPVPPPTPTGIVEASATTGGGNQENYPPSLIDLFIPPTPVPRSVSGARVVAEFDVDEKGKVLSVNFTQTRDRGYNRKLSELFKEFRFRPGTTPDGRAIRMKAQVAFDL